MKKIGLNELRQMFRDFYISKGHFPQKSFSLVPDNDKSLMVINSGMAPLKPYFAGVKEPPSKRMTTCQKCIRTGDLDNVGHTARHGTFFEMLGSFSFGDYFKKESLLWGWEFMIDVLELPEDKLWASIYLEDDEAYDIWANDVGIDPARIVRMGKEDNFWEIGIGPCGPCSEVYFDRGEKYGCGSPDCKPGCECDRFVEFWNHVFTQFNRDEEGNYTPLAHPNIDTGMGLERLACIMQDVDSIFNVDTIKHVLDSIVELSGVEYHEGTKNTDISIRIITDHIRSVAFMIADGIIPGNEGRGYVLRRLLRRAVVHGKKLGINDLFLYELVDKVIETSEHEYTELGEKKDYIKKIIKTEEERFAKTIDQGMDLINEHISDLKGSIATILSGDKVFKLYDTYGVNPELTKEVLEEHGIAIDEEGYAAELRRQQENSRNNMKATDDDAWEKAEEIFADQSATEFVGYDTLQEKSYVNLIVVNGESVDEAKEGSEVSIVLDKTPFYAESGGQTSDIGIMSTDSVNVEISSVTKAKDVFVHRGTVSLGTLKKGVEIDCSVDRINRFSTARNHTATHMLHKALANTVGTHVKQAGSFVSADVLRFDFSHYEAVDTNQLLDIQEIVNNAINMFMPVTTIETSIAEAKERGATALFDEKYGEKVRLVTVGEFSAELCGGTHVSNSGEVGAFKIVSETSIGSGTRRIEAVTGTNLVKPLLKAENILATLAGRIKTNPEAVLNKVSAMLENMKEIRKELDETKKSQTGSLVDDLLAQTESVSGIKLIKQSFDDLGVDEMRTMSDELKAKEQGLVIVFVSTLDEKLTMIVSISDDLVSKGMHSGKMVKELAGAAGGGGGGKADMAQAGAKDPSKVPEVFTQADEYIKQFIG